MMTINDTDESPTRAETPRARAHGSPPARGVRTQRIATAGSQRVPVSIRLRESAPKILCGTISVAVVVGLYWIYTAQPGSNQVLTPPPPKVLDALIYAIMSGQLFVDVAVSLARVLVGFILGVALAVVLGCAAGWFRTAGYFLNPLIDAIRPIPALAYIPLIIVWVGIDEPARVLIILLAVFKPCVVNTRQGMKEVPRIYVEAAQSLGASGVRTFWRVGLPNAIPFMVAGMRTGLSTGFMALVAAELIASSNGLGFLISNAGQNLRIDVVLMGIIVIGIVATILDNIMVRIQAHLTRWSEVRL